MHLFNLDDDVAVPNAMAVLNLCGPVAQMAQMQQTDSFRVEPWTHVQ